jgi:SAM-dependent methyltransferase
MTCEATQGGHATPITAEEERGFYDAFYAQYLTFPDAALRCDRVHFLASLQDPGHPFYERRRLYGQAFEILLAQPLTGRRVLDYGCGTGEWGVLLATEGADVTLLDLSPVGIEVGLRRAALHGVAARVHGVARDASDLSCFDAGSFDLVFASAALHHTLKYPNALAELERVLRPGGQVVLAETYGNNRLLNAARRLRARVSRERAEQGEEIVISEEELGQLRARFPEVDLRPLNLLAMAKRLGRGRFTFAPTRWAVLALEALDRGLLAALPPLRRYCGEVIVIATKGSR